MEDARSPSELFPELLAEVRRRKGWSQRRLAAEMTELGETMDHATISRIEVGRRSVTVDELMWFAAALGVSPLALVFPRGRELIQVAPGLTVLSDGAVDWLRGLQPLTYGGEEPDVRFFNEQRPDFEVEAERVLPGVLRFLEDVATMVRVAGYNVDRELTVGHLDRLSEDAVALRRHLEREEPDGD